MRIGTRGSRLALAQTDIMMDMLDPLKLNLEVVTVSTLGDRDRDTPLADFGGHGAFVKELDNFLLEGHVDVTVNSLKDMPVRPTPGTVLAAVLPRGNPADALIPCSLDELPIGSRIGSSSVRRTAMMKRLRPDLIFAPLRGNVETRLAKQRTGEFDAIVLAQAGLERLGLDPPRTELPLEDFIPSAGQGAIALVCRDDDNDVLEIIRRLDHPPTRSCVELEREVLRRLEAGCSAPLGVHARAEGNGFQVLAMALHPLTGEFRKWSGHVSGDDLGDLVEAIELLREVMP